MQWRGACRAKGVVEQEADELGVHRRRGDGSGRCCDETLQLAVGDATLGTCFLCLRSSHTPKWRMSSTQAGETTVPTPNSEI